MQGAYQVLGDGVALDVRHQAEGWLDMAARLLASPARSPILEAVVELAQVVKASQDTQPISGHGIQRVKSTEARKPACEVGLPEEGLHAARHIDTVVDEGVPSDETSVRVELELAPEYRVAETVLVHGNAPRRC